MGSCLSECWDGMRSGRSEVLQLLSVLTSYNGILPAQMVGMALLGLSSCDVLDCKLSVDKFVGRMLEIQLQDSMRHMNRTSITSLILAADSLLQSDV